MRKVNSIAAMAVMFLFVIHLIWGALVLFGAVKGGSPVFSVLTRVMLVFIAVHVVLSIIMTAQSVHAIRQSGVSYWKENRLFWVRRLSGFALMAFIIVHMLIFHGNDVGGAYVLTLFDAPALISQILMVASLLLHLVTNIRPLKIAFGLSDKRNLRTDIALILSILLLIAGAAFVVYFIRWMTL